MQSKTASQQPLTHRVLIVDDDEDLRQLLRILLESEEDFEVVGEGDGLDCVSLALKLEPDVVVLDLEMPGVTGLEALALIRLSRPAAKAIIYTSDASPGMERQAMALGAVACVHKDRTLELTDAVRAAFDGHSR